MLKISTHIPYSSTFQKDKYTGKDIIIIIKFRKFLTTPEIVPETIRLRLDIFLQIFFDEIKYFKSIKFIYYI